MISDDQAPTEKQQFQLQAGAALAMRCAIAALIETHPNHAAFSASLQRFADMTSEALLTRLAIQKDDGLRQGYSEALQSFQSITPQR